MLSGDPVIDVIYIVGMIAVTPWLLWKAARWVERKLDQRKQEQEQHHRIREEQEPKAPEGKTQLD